MKFIHTGDLHYGMKPDIGKPWSTERAQAVKDALDVTPPDLASDLMYYGILLTGGGGMLRGLDQRLREETGVPVNVSPTALENVVTGCAKVLEANALSGGFVQSAGQ